jgi:glutamine synthetase
LSLNVSSSEYSFSFLLKKSIIGFFGSEYTSSIVRLQNEMTEARKEANNIEELEARAVMYSTKVKNYFEEIRYSVDKLELIIDDDEWPLPKYREILLIK